MFRKIISLVSNNRGVRDKEVNGVDYNFVPRESIQRSLANGELLQHIKIGEVEYGYAKKDFIGADELIVVCGGSGVGKDTALNGISKMEHPLFKNKDSRFLLSIPKTIPLFSDYAKEMNIPATIIFLHATEEERLRRVIVGNILADEALCEKYHFSPKMLYNEVLVEKGMKVSIFSLDTVPDDIQSIVATSIKRVERDNMPQSFYDDILGLKNTGYDIKIVDVTNASTSEATYLLLEAIEKGRGGQYAEGEEEEIAYSIRQESLQKLLLGKVVGSLHRSNEKADEVLSLISVDFLSSYLDTDTDAMHYMLFGEGEDEEDIVNNIFKKNRDKLKTTVREKYYYEKEKRMIV